MTWNIHHSHFFYNNSMFPIKAELVLKTDGSQRCCLIDSILRITIRPQADDPAHFDHYVVIDQVFDHVEFGDSPDPNEGTHPIMEMVMGWDGSKDAQYPGAPRRRNLFYAERMADLHMVAVWIMNSLTETQWDITWSTPYFEIKSIVREHLPEVIQYAGELRDAYLGTADKFLEA